MSITFKNPALAFYIEDANKAVPTFSETSGALKLQFLRLVNEDLNTIFNREESNEIRGDAQTSGSLIASASGSGTISIEWSLDTYDELLAGLLFAQAATTATKSAGRIARDWGWEDLAAGGAVALDSGTTTGWTLSGNTLTLTGSSPIITLGDSDTVLIDGSGEPNLDGVWRLDGDVSAAAAIELYNDTGEADVETYVSASSGTGTITFTRGEQICRNGTNDVTFGFIRCYSDVSAAGSTGVGAVTTDLTSVDWAQFRQAYITALQLSVAPGQAGWTGSFSVLFSDEVVQSDVTATGSNIMPDWRQTEIANSNPIPDAINGVAQITIRNKTTNAVARHDALSMNVNIANNSEEVSALRNRGALCINQGTMSIGIDIELIYEGSVFHDSMLDDDPYEVEFVIRDSDGKAQLWRFGKCRLTSERPNPGKNAPIVQTLSLIAEAGGTPFGSEYLVDADVATTKMIEVVRFYDATAFSDNT